MTWDGWNMLNHEMTWGATGQVQDDSPGPGMASGSKVESHESTQPGRSRIWVGDCRGRWCVKEKPLNHLLVVWNMNGLYCSIDWEFHDPKWRTHIFQRGWNHQPALSWNVPIEKSAAIHIAWAPPKNKELEERTWKNKGNLVTIRIATTELQLAI